MPISLKYKSATVFLSGFVLAFSWHAITPKFDGDSSILHFLVGR